MIQCPICKFQSNEFKQIICDCKLPVWNKNKLIRYKCSQCDVIFGTLEILNESKELLKERYQKLYNSGWRETDSTEAEFSIIKKLNLKSGQTCLNWGGGSVSKTKEKAKSLGIELYLYEPFDQYAKNVITKIDGLNKYDSIISNNLMEHLQDPVSELILMSNHLNDNGIMIHKTPCWDYVYEWTEYHLFFFVGRSVEIMSANAGLISNRLDDDCIKFTKIT